MIKKIALLLLFARQAGVLTGRDFEALATPGLIVNLSLGEVNEMPDVAAQPRQWWPVVLVPVFILTGIGLRFIAIDFITVDMRGYLAWYDILALEGLRALRERFSMYTPPYLYLLFLAAHTLGFLPKIVAIKLISICFDFLNAVLVYRILRLRYPSGATAWMGAATFLLLPTLWLNSAVWGQVDSIYVSFLLVCLFFLMSNRSLPAMIALGLSFSFKAQAVFLGPLILLLMIRKKIPWYYLAIVPAAYLLMMVPAALSGRPIAELLTIYLYQGELYRGLSMFAPNLYLFIPIAFYEPAVAIGITMTAALAILWAAIYARRIQEFTQQMILLCALVSAALMPFCLPKMHDRYFYLAEVLSLLVAFYFPRLWRLALGYQLVSGLTYAVVLSMSAVPVDTTVAASILILAAFINTGLIGYLLCQQWKLTEGSTPKVQPV